MLDMHVAFDPELYREKIDWAQILEGPSGEALEQARPGDPLDFPVAEKKKRSFDDPPTHGLVLIMKRALPRGRFELWFAHKDYGAEATSHRGPPAKVLKLTYAAEYKCGTLYLYELKPAEPEFG